MSTNAIRIAAACCVVFVVAFAAATARLFVWPSAWAPPRADAVVVFGARNAVRLEEGLRLANEGVAPVLVLMTPPAEAGVCRDRPNYEVVCRVPEPFSTRGEAQSAGELARGRGWGSVVLVTSTQHVTRARLLLERCFGGTVAANAAGSSGDLPRMVELIAHEWAGIVHAVTLSRGC